MVAHSSPCVCIIPLYKNDLWESSIHRDALSLFAFLWPMERESILREGEGGTRRDWSEEGSGGKGRKDIQSIYKVLQLD